MKKTFLAVAILGAFLATDTQARDRSHSGVYATGKGKAGTYSVQKSGNLKEGLTKRKTVTTGQGKTYGRTVQQQYNKETGAYTKTVTGDNGKTVTYTGTAKDGVRTGTYTTGNGKTGSYTQNLSKGENGELNKTTNITTSSGQQVTTSSSSTYDKETNTLNSTVTGPKGESHSGSVSVTPDKQQ